MSARESAVEGQGGDPAASAPKIPTGRALLLVAVTIGPVLTGLFGTAYLVAALALGAQAGGAAEQFLEGGERGTEVRAEIPLL